MDFFRLLLVIVHCQGLPKVLSQIQIPMENPRDISRCIGTIAERNLFDSSTVAVHAGNLNLQFNNTCLMQISDGLRLENKFNFRIEAYVLVVDDLWHLKRILQRLSHGQFLDYMQKYVVVLDVGGPTIEDAVRLLWHFDIIKIALIASGSVFKFSGECDRVERLQRTCDSTDLFVADPGKCKIKVRTAIWPPFVEDTAKKVPNTKHDFQMGGGLDVMIMNTVANRLGLEVVWSMSGTTNEWNDDFVNDNDDNNFHLLYARKVDVIINSAIPTINREKYFYLTPHYYYDSDGFCVPSASKRPQYTKWLDSLEIYLYVFGCMVFVVPILYLYEMKHRYIGEVFLDCVSIASGLCSNYVPKTVKARGLLMIWIIFTFLMNMFYQTQLISVMYKPLYDRQVATEEDLARSDLRLLFLDHYRRYFINKNTSSNKEIVRRMEKCADIDVCLKNVTEDRNAAVCIQLTFINYRLDRYLDDDGKLKLYCFKESVNSSPLIVLMNRNFRHLTGFVFLLQACRDTGLIDKLSKDYFEDVRKKTSRAKDIAAYSPLKLRNLYIMFYIFLIGIGSSFILFLVEIFNFNCITSWKRIN